MPATMTTTAPTTTTIRPAAVPLSNASLVELALAEARDFRDLGTEAGKIIAAAMEELAQMLMFTHATTLAEHEARTEVLDADAREHWHALGRAEAPTHCPRCGSSL